MLFRSNDWLVSKTNTFKVNKLFIDGKQITNQDDYLTWVKKYHNFTDNEQVFLSWIDFYYQRLNNVRTFFEDKPNDIVYFDLDKEQYKFIDFMKSMTHIVNSKFPLVNKTK